MSSQIHSDSQIGSVSLTIRNLAQSVDFYQRLGMTLRKQGDGVAHLGTATTLLLVLHENKDARIVERTSGLYHFAILVPTRLELAQVLKNLAKKQIPIQGYSDHLVSEAIYLADPDGNGIEIYRDRPRKAWQYVDGKLQIGTIPLDLQAILSELNKQDIGWDRFSPDTQIGHMHLHVGDLAAAQTFYTVAIGFDLVANYGSAAAFVSAGGYHHHLGMNTWAGKNAPPSPADGVGLRWFEIQLPTQGALDEVQERLQETAVSINNHPKGLLIHDPSQNGILLTHK